MRSPPLSPETGVSYSVSGRLHSSALFPAPHHEPGPAGMAARPLLRARNPPTTTRLSELRSGVQTPPKQRPQRGVKTTRSTPGGGGSSQGAPGPGRSPQGRGGTVSGPRPALPATAPRPGDPSAGTEEPWWLFFFLPPQDGCSVEGLSVFQGGRAHGRVSPLSVR